MSVRLLVALEIDGWNDLEPGRKNAVHRHALAQQLEVARPRILDGSTAGPNWRLEIVKKPAQKSESGEEAA